MASLINSNEIIKSDNNGVQIARETVKARRIIETNGVLVSEGQEGMQYFNLYKEYEVKTADMGTLSFRVYRNEVALLAA